MEMISRYVVVVGLGAFGSAALWRLACQGIDVAGGDSGHGFKHCPGIGELLAQIVAGRELYTAADFLDPARFT